MTSGAGLLHVVQQSQDDIAEQANKQMFGPVGVVS